MRLDEALADWQFRERHSIPLPGGPERALAAVELVTWAEVPVGRALMAARSLGRDRLPSAEPILRSMTAQGFTVLDRTESELVIVAVAATFPGRREPAPGAAPSFESFRDFDEPGFLTIAFNFRYEDGVLHTETRVRATDRRSRTAFRLYWTIIRLPSGLIRRVWLSAIRNRALTTPAQPGM